jgi:hypothetical protein
MICRPPASNRILAATAAAVGSPLIIGFRLQRDAEPFYAHRISGVVEAHSGNADWRVITPRHQTWEEVELAIRATICRRIQHAFNLLRITRLRFHHHSQTLQLKTHLSIPFR